MFGSVLFHHLGGDDRVYNIRANSFQTTAAATTTTLIFSPTGPQEQIKGAKLAGLAEQCIIVSGVGLAVGRMEKRVRPFLVFLFFFIFFLINCVKYNGWVG